MAGLEDASPFELDTRLRRAVRLEQRRDAAMGPLLRQVSSAEYEWKGPFSTLGAYAREQLARRLDEHAVGGRQVCVQPRPAQETWGLEITAPTEVARLFRAVLCTLRRALRDRRASRPAAAGALHV